MQTKAKIIIGLAAVAIVGVGTFLASSGDQKGALVWKKSQIGSKNVGQSEYFAFTKPSSPAPNTKPNLRIESVKTVGYGTYYSVTVKDANNSTFQFPDNAVSVRLFGKEVANNSGMKCTTNPEIVSLQGIGNATFTGSMQMTCPSTFPPGKSITAQVDPDNKIAETDEGDNYHYFSDETKFDAITSPIVSTPDDQPVAIEKKYQEVGRFTITAPPSNPTILYSIKFYCEGTGVHHANTNIELYETSNNAPTLTPVDDKNCQDGQTIDFGEWGLPLNQYVKKVDLGLFMNTGVTEDGEPWQKDETLRFYIQPGDITWSLGSTYEDTKHAGYGDTVHTSYLKYGQKDQKPDLTFIPEVFLFMNNYAHWPEIAFRIKNSGQMATPGAVEVLVHAYGKNKDDEEKTFTFGTQTLGILEAGETSPFFETDLPVFDIEKIDRIEFEIDPANYIDEGAFEDNNSYSTNTFIRRNPN